VNRISTIDVIGTLSARLGQFPDPYPVEDSYAGLTWLASHADEMGVDPDRIIVAGACAAC
jgi:acetyl esterase/lipase